MGRRERPIDPQAGPVEKLAWELRQLREAAGRPSYRELARRAHYAASTLSDTATGRRLPSLEATIAYAQACGGDPGAWEKRWQETADEVEQSQRRCPYPGLAPLGAEDSDLFFGRSRLLGELCAATDDFSLTIVFGASGSGKSSLLLAGLVPALRTDGTEVVCMTPGFHPRAELETCLSAIESGSGVLVIDQFEETFTLCADESECDEFLKATAKVASKNQLSIVIGVRADFLVHCAGHAEFAAALRGAAHLPIGPMTETELREIVVEPAHRVGLIVEPELVATVLAGASGQPGALPLIAHALRETWRGTKGDTLTLADYRTTGGVHEAIARTAEELYADFDERDQEIARAIFLRLTALGDGTEDTRRRVAREELVGIAEAGEVDTVLDRLVAARLVVTAEGDVEIAHEVLIGAWPRLRDWLAADRDDLRLHRRLTEAAAEWDRGGQAEEYLYRGSRLAVWDGRDLPALNDVERAFLQASRAAQDRERAASRRRVRTGVGGLACALVVTCVLAAVALVQAGHASDERDGALSRQLAADARRQLLVDPELALLLAVKAQEKKTTEAADMVLRQALVDSRVRQAVPVSPTGASGSAFSSDGRRLAIWGAGGGLQIRDFSGAVPGRTPQSLEDEHSSPTDAPVFSADGKRLAYRMGSGSLKVWDADAGSAARVVRTGTVNPPGAVDIHGRLASVETGNDRTVRIWDPAGRRKTLVLRVPGLRVMDFAFSPDGKRLATVGVSSPLRVWDVSGSRPRALRSAPAGSPSPDRVVYSPDGRWLVTARGDAVQVWHAAGWPGGVPWEARAELTGHGGLVEGVAFSPDGRRLATYGTGRTIRVWVTGSDISPVLLRLPRGGPGGAVKGAGFSPDGRRLGTVSADGALRLWDISGYGARGSAELRGDPGNGVNAALSADGRMVARTAMDKAASAASGEKGRTTIRVWDTARGGEPATLPGLRDSVPAIALSPDGRRLAAGGSDGVVRLWDLRGDPSRPALISRSGQAVRALVFSRDGRFLAGSNVASEGARVWRISGRGAPAQEGRGVWGSSLGGSALALSPDGRYLAHASDREGAGVEVVDLHGKERPKRLRTAGKETIDRLVFGPGGRQLAGAARDGTIHLWRLSGQGEPVSVLRDGDGAADFASKDLAFSPDGNWLAAAGSAGDGGTRLWRTTGTAEPIVIGGQGAAIGHIAFSPDGSRLTTTLEKPVATAKGKELPPTGLENFVAPTWNCEICGSGQQILALARTRATRKLTAWERQLYLGSAENGNLLPGGNHPLRIIVRSLTCKDAP